VVEVECVVEVKCVTGVNVGFNVPRVVERNMGNYCCRGGVSFNLVFLANCEGLFNRQSEGQRGV